MKCRVSIEWTETAKESLKALPKKVRKGLLDKADELLEGGDPRQAHKPLVGPLAGLYSIKYSRYRALYQVTEERTAGGVLLLHLRVTFVLAGQRKEFDKHDVYRVAEKLAVLLFAPPRDVERAEAKPGSKRKRKDR